MIYMYIIFFFFKQKTAYELRISDWSSDVCSSDLTVCPSFRRRLPAHCSDRTGRERPVPSPLRPSRTVAAKSQTDKRHAPRSGTGYSLGILSSLADFHVPEWRIGRGAPKARRVGPGPPFRRPIPPPSASPPPALPQ